MNSFLTREEVEKIGFKYVGENVLISKNAQFYGVENISLGDHVRIDDFCLMSGMIEFQGYNHIAAYTAFFAGDAGITIKKFAGISSRVSIYAISDDFSGAYLTGPMVPSKYTNYRKEKVILGEHVVIGASAVILPGVNIGKGVAIGSCSMVVQDCQEWGIYAGCPAKKIKDRKKDLMQLEKEVEDQNR